MPNSSHRISVPIIGMHCASCAKIIERSITKLPGVNSIQVNYALERASISFNTEQTSTNAINESIKKFGYSLDFSEPDINSKDKINQMNRLINMQRSALLTFPISFITFGIMLWDLIEKQWHILVPLPIPMDVLNTLFFAVASIILFYFGKQFIYAVKIFIQNKVANMDTLVGIGTMVAYFYSTILFLFPNLVARLGLSSTLFFDVTIVVIGFVLFGKYLEAKSKQKTGEAIEKLISLQAKFARVIRDNSEHNIPIDQVVVGDTISIKPGDTIPVDGKIISGESVIDQSIVTGESLPVDKNIGDEVISGTTNISGSFMFLASKVGKETLLARIIQMVAEAEGSVAPIEKLADKISAIFIPIVLITACASLFLWITVGAFFLGLSQALILGLTAFVSILVIACPCALGLATPTGIIVGVGRAAKNGILIRDAESLEKLEKVKIIVFDKTGTITTGKPSVKKFISIDEPEKINNLAILGSLEKNSDHPLAHAIEKYCVEKMSEVKTVSKFINLPGYGIEGNIDNVTYIAGNKKLMDTKGVTFPESLLQNRNTNGESTIYLATKNKIIAFVTIADTIKPESSQAIAACKKLGITPVLLTGDHSDAAEHMAKQAGIDRVIADVLPDEKVMHIKKLQEKNTLVAMVGDGVNDAPALATANIGIAMATGSDIAISSSQITILHGDIEKVIIAVKLAQATMRIIRQNLFWAFCYNTIGIPLASGIFYPFFGFLLPPMFAGMAMAFSSVSVVINSLRLKHVRI